MNGDNRSGADKTKILFVTGFSGAGRSTGLKILEDLGYEVFDNIPLHIVGSLIDAEEPPAHIAVGIDTRTRYFSAEKLLAELERLNGDARYEAQLVFMLCDDVKLQQRYSETRRPHPMANDRSVSDGIRMEAEILEPLLGHADYSIDTTTLSVHDLRDDFLHKFAINEASQMQITIKSFGFKQGAPRDVDMVFDVRFLRNPHWDAALRNLTGQDEAVGAYVAADEDFAAFWANITSMMALLLPRYQKEGKSYLTIGFGCMGGKHRSVYCTEKLATQLKKQGYNVNMQHRDMPR
tara:strand:+ start:253286 stop:254164 length:879 start_codon:yes stop_codon:yes gene_type:complete